MTFLLDLIIILLFIVFVIIGIKRGAIKTLLTLVSVWLSVFLSSVLGSNIAQWVYDAFFKNGIIEGVNNTLTQTGAADSVEKTLESIPDVVFNALSAFGITKDSLLSQTEGAVDSAQISVSNAVEGVISPILTSIISFFLIIILFILLIVLFKFILKLVNGLFELPILNMFNKAAGGVLGAIEGVALIYLFAVLIKIVLPFTGEDFFITQQMIDESIIFKTIYDINIFSNITELSEKAKELTLKN